MYHYSTGGVHSIRVFNLIGPTPSVPTIQFDVTTNTDRVTFSPNGLYLLYAALTSTSPTQHVMLQVRDAISGSQVYATEFSFEVVSSKFRGRAWHDGLGL